jgi:hypothetical protein
MSLFKNKKDKFSNLKVAMEEGYSKGHAGKNYRRTPMGKVIRIGDSYYFGKYNYPAYLPEHSLKSANKLQKKAYRRGALNKILSEYDVSYGAYKSAYEPIWENQVLMVPRESYFNLIENIKTFSSPERKKILNSYLNKLNKAVSNHMDALKIYKKEENKNSVINRLYALYDTAFLFVDSASPNRKIKKQYIEKLKNSIKESGFSKIIPENSLEHEKREKELSYSSTYPWPIMRGSREASKLESSIWGISFGGAFLCSLLFFSANITGNTILNSSIKDSNIIGALLFIVGLVAAFFYFKKK